MPLPDAGDDAVADLLAKQEIYEVVCRYCRGIDRLDLELVRDCYHPDAVDHHVGFDGPIEEYLAWVGTALERLEGSMHTVANHLVEFDGPYARSETYVNAWTWWRSDDGTVDLHTTGSRYVDRFELRGGRWRILERWATRSFMRSESGGVRLADPTAGPVGTRDEHDPVRRPIAPPDGRRR